MRFTERLIQSWRRAATAAGYPEEASIPPDVTTFRLCRADMEEWRDDWGRPDIQFLLDDPSIFLDDSVPAGRVVFEFFGPPAVE